MHESSTVASRFLSVTIVTQSIHDTLTAWHFRRLDTYSAGARCRGSVSNVKEDRCDRKDTIVWYAYKGGVDDHALRSIYGLLLRQLHWLPVESQLRFKIALLTYKVRSTSTPCRQL